MSSEVEFSGRTVEQAVEKACQQLEINEEYLNFTVVSKGSTGLFGIVGAKKARINVFLKEKQIDRLHGHPKPETPADLGKPRPTRETPTAAARAGQEAIEKIANGITTGARVAIREEGKQISYDIRCEKAGVLIGKRGQTLEAIQYLVEKVVNRSSQERLRVHIDVGGYLAKKRKNLESLARRTAQKAKKNRKPATVGQLNAHDRRIIHLALKNDPEVTTKSMGNGFLRKLVVLPKKRRRSPKRQT